MKAWRILEYRLAGPIIIATDEGAKDAIVAQIERQYGRMAIVHETELETDTEDAEFEEVSEEKDESDEEAEEDS